MRRSREDAALTRQKIVDAASRLFRARGIDAVSVADIMSSLGLTVGGFYRHFDSKEALVAEAIESASQQSSATAEQYLSMEHRANLERGCPVAGLCSEIAHQGRSTKKAFGRAVEGLIARVDAASPGVERKRVLTAAAALVGGLVLARGTTDEKLAREILDAVRSSLKKR